MSVTITPASLTSPGTLSRAPLPANLTAETKTPQVTPRWVVVIVAMAALAAACALLAWRIKDPDFPPGDGGDGNLPVDGMTIFSVFFVAALAIERLLEPLSGWLVPTDAAKQKATESLDKARVAIATVQGQSKPTAEVVSEAQHSLEVATQHLADLAEKRWQRGVWMWTIASVVGMVAAALLKLYFLNTVGIAEASRWQEILATGLIIGAGTKPLHDLTELITAKKQASESKP